MGIAALNAWGWILIITHLNIIKNYAQRNKYKMGRNTKQRRLPVFFVLSSFVLWSLCAIFHWVQRLPSRPPFHLTTHLKCFCTYNIFRAASSSIVFPKPCFFFLDWNTILIAALIQSIASRVQISMSACILSFFFLYEALRGNDNFTENRERLYNLKFKYYYANVIVYYFFLFGVSCIPW